MNKKPIIIGQNPPYQDNAMTTILPEGEHIRNTVKWISEEKQNNPCKSMTALLDEAAMRFNLSPKETESLIRILKDKCI